MRMFAWGSQAVEHDGPQTDSAVREEPGRSDLWLRS